MNLMHILLLGAPAGGAEGGGSNPSQFILLIGIVVIFYFFMIRPQMKKQKELKKYRESLQKGDKVITIGGIYGKIVELKEDSALIEVDENVKLRVAKSAITNDSNDIVEKK